MMLLAAIKKKLSGKGEIKATLFYLISNICTKAFGFITIPLYTHILTTSEYGYLNTYNAWVSLLSVIMGLALSSAILGKSKLPKEERDGFQSATLSLSLVSALILLVVVLGTYILVYGRFDIIVLLALIQGYGLFIVNFILQEWVIDNKYIRHSLVSVGSVVIPITVTCLIIKKVFQESKYLCVIIPRATVLIILTIIIILAVLVRGKLFYNKEYWIWSLKYCIPIVFHSLSLTIMLQADRIMISGLYSLDESGIYSFIYNVTLVVGVLVAALENTWKTWFFKNYESSGKELIQKRCKLFSMVAVLGISVYVFIAPDMIRFLASPEYHTQVFLIGPIAFAYIISFLYDFPVYVEYKKEATKKIAYASILAAVVNVGLNFIIIPKFGGVGAACTTCVAYAIQFVMHLIIANKLDKGLYPIKIFLPFIGIGAIVLIAFLLSLDYLIVRYLLAVISVVAMLWIVIKNKNILSGAGGK